MMIRPMREVNGVMGWKLIRWGGTSIVKEGPLQEGYISVEPCIMRHGHKRSGRKASPTQGTARAKALRRRKMSYTRRSEWRSRRPSAVISRRKSSRGQQGLGAAQSLWLWKEINICSKILFWDMNWGSSHSPTSLIFRCPVTLSNCFQRMGPARGERADARSIDTTRLALFLKLVAEITGVKDNVL